MLKFSQQWRNKSWVYFVNVFPKSNNLTTKFTSSSNCVIDFWDLFFLWIASWDFAEVDCSWADLFNNVEDELTVSDWLVLNVLDLMLSWYFAVSPLNQDLIVDLTNSFFKVKLAQLPNNTQSKCSFTIDNIDTSNTNNFQTKLFFTDIDNVVTILYDMNSAMKLVWILVPINSTMSQVIDNF